jgi:prepilin-type N-terminal cleavage/methylation domain-containing protein
MTRPGRGFTLIELLITLAILGVLAMAAVPAVEVAVQRANEQELRHALRTLRDGIDAYKRAHDEGRIAAKTGDTGYPPNLQVLVDGVVDQRDPNKSRLRFLRRIPRDPLAGEMTKDASGTWAIRSFASSAERPTEGDDVYDVSSRSTRTGLNGLRYDTW